MICFGWHLSPIKCGFKIYFNIDAHGTDGSDGTQKVYNTAINH
jgi:hypothetical protein